MSRSENTVQDVARRALAAKIIQFAGFADIVVGIGIGFVGPMLVPGMDTIWWIVGAALAVGGMAVIFIGRRMDPGNMAR